MKKLVYSILMTIFFVNLNLAQGEAAVPFLQLPHSMQSYSSGWSGVSAVTDNPMGYYFNPAILGATARTNHASMYFQAGDANWLGMNHDDLSPYTWGINLGYNFKKELGIPISVGIGYINYVFDFGEMVRTDAQGIAWGTFSPEDKYHSFSIGINLDYLISLSIGMSIKDYTSSLADIVYENTDMAEASGTAIDYGILAELSSKKIFCSSDFWNFGNNSYRFFTDISLGYSVSNIGSDVSYIDDAQKDPLPEKARLGYSVKAGLDYKFKNHSITLLGYTFIGEASDMLFDRDSLSNIIDKGMMGDIKFGDHLIELKGDDDVTVHTGHNFVLLETLYFNTGKFHGPGYDNRKTSGLGFSTSGLFKILSGLTKDKNWKYLFDHFVVTYSNAVFFKNSEMETEIDGISIHFNNICL